MKTIKITQIIAGVAGAIVTLGSQAQAQWATRAPIPTQRDHSGFCVLNNKLYVFGGQYQCCGYITDRNEVYDPISDSWSSGAPLPQPLYSPGAVAVGGKILVLGGDPQGPPNFEVPDVNAYDPASDTWSTRAPMPIAHESFVTVEVNGLVYAIGGYPLSDGGKSSK